MYATVTSAVVLAAGLGTRLAWLTRERPKAMMNLAGEPAIVHVIRALAAQGVRFLAINVHYRPERIMAALGDGSALGVHIRYSREDHLLDSGGGVRQAMELLPDDECVLVHNADILTDLPLALLARKLPAGKGGVLGLVPNPPHHPSGDFSCHAGRMARTKPRPWTYAGVSLWHRQTLALWPAGARFPLTDCIEACMNDGNCTGAIHRGFWVDIGRPADLFRADAYLRQRM
ncbi:MAG: nucleotidyltransferase family protein [Zetaproteobacteria bacterium]|nr:MAG: nucleotidyltransferase family protein [Zetaproteobacteria bacterium]